MQSIAARIKCWSLRKQVLVGMCLLTLTVSFAAAELVARLESRYLSETIERYGGDVLSVLHSSALEAMIVEDQPLLRSIGEELLKRDLSMTRVIFRNELGKAVVTAEAGDAGERTRSARSLREDIRYLGEIFGSVEITWDLSEQYREIERHSLVIAVVVAALLVMLTAAIYGGITVSVLRPIAALDQQVRGYAGGDLGTRVSLPPLLARELLRLGQSVELLGEELKADRRRTAELEAARMEADRASKAKSDFLASMSHELRTPLNAIIGFSDVIRSEMMGPVGNPRYSDYAEDIRRSGLYLLDLIRDILDLVKVEAGKLELEESRIEFAGFIDETLKMVAETARSKGLHLSRSVPAGIYLWGDRRRLRQILLNLVSNALKFTGRGGRTDVVVTLDRAGCLVLSVRDDGRGIAAEDISKALEPFGQVRRSVYESVEGTGLGLPICKNFAELHGATFEILSEPGQGTEVRIAFPARRVMPPPREDAGAERRLAKA